MITAKLTEDRQANAIEVLSDRGIPEPQHPQILLFEVGCAPSVISGLLRMLPAVDLHDEPRLHTEKIDDVGSDADLASPPPAAQPSIT